VRASDQPCAGRLPSAAAVVAALEERTAAVDGLVLNAAADTLESELGGRFALIAMGGYGRRELFPYSDVDILVLLGAGVTPETARAPVGRFVQRLWDERLRLSQAVHTVEECCAVNEQNVERTISLLDRRRLTGDAALTDELERRLPAFYRNQRDTISRNLARLTRARHAKFQNTIYHLEPNVKDGPGGLRDVHLLEWLHALNGGGPAPAGETSDARTFLMSARYFLHQEAKRDQNVLTFDAQEAMSPSPEDMMREYYRLARGIYRLASDALEAVEERGRSLLVQFRDWRSRASNADFTIRRDRVFLRSPAQLEANPELLIALFEFVAHHGIPLSRDAERRIPQALVQLGRRLFHETRWRHVRAVLGQPHAALALRAMCDTGAMQAILPEWRQIDCLVVRDFYHRYTVDEHTLVAIEQLEHVDDPRFQELAAEIDDRALLKLAALLHDIGKGSGRHVEASARIAANVAERLGMRSDERDTLVFLVQKHLELSAAMTARDLEDPATQRALAESTGPVERLKMLAMLTWADISAVNPTAMTPWRREQLWRAYVTVYAELTRELDTDRIHDARAMLAPDLAEFVEGFPRRYLRTHTEEEIRRHYELARAAARTGVAAAVERRDGFNHLLVAGRDRPFLFATLCGALAAFGMNILKAEAFSNAAGTVLDSFIFSDPNRTLELNPSEIERLEGVVTRAVNGKVDVNRLLANRRQVRHLRQFEPRITFDNEASQHATLVEITAADRPGLLHALASAMSKAGCDIVLVLVDTEAQRALDVFYVTLNGAKLTSQAQAQVEAALRQACRA
jgi:[protein-PII] uridylyltransferase